MAGMYHKPVSIPWGGQWGISSPEVIATREAWTPPWKKGPAGAPGAAMNELMAVCCPFPPLQASPISGCQKHLTGSAEGDKGLGYGCKVGCGMQGVGACGTSPASELLLPPHFVQGQTQRVSFPLTSL